MQGVHGQRKMNSRDLLVGLLAGSGFDRVGLYELFWGDALSGWVEQGYPVYDAAGEGGEQVGKPKDPAIVFDFDIFECGGGFDIDPLRGRREVVAETEEWVIRRNGAGAALKFWKHKSGTPEHIDFLMTSRDIWERDYRPHLLYLDPARFDSGNWKGTTLAQDKARLGIGRAGDKWCSYWHIFVWEIMRQSMGDICMYESLALDPGWIHDYNRVYTDFLKSHFQALFEEQGLPDGIKIAEDLAYKNGLFASPRMLGELVFPYYAELVEFFHSYGLPVLLHTCGNVTAALPLIVDAGFDALNPMEVKAGCDMFRFAELYGDKLVFIGGLDVRILETNDRELITREVVCVVEGMKALGARYIFGSDHSISPLVTYDTYKYTLDVYREHMWY